MKPKTFFIISALQADSSPLGKLIRFPTERDAIDHAKEVIQRRCREGLPLLSFYVLKISTVVEPVAAPIKVTKLG